MASIKTEFRNTFKGLSNLSFKSADPYIAQGEVVVPSAFRNNPGSPGWFFGPNGVDYKFKYEDTNSCTSAYRGCPPLAAVINRKAQAYINGKTWVMDGQNNEAASSDALKLKKLLANPNPLQSWKQFEAQQYIYIQLFGFCPVLPIAPYGFSKPLDSSSFWNIPPYMLDIEESNKLFYNAQSASDVILSIKLKYKDLDVTIDATKLFIFKDFVPSFDSMVIPGSRIQSLQLPINNIIAAYESRNELINYAGSQGILTPKTDATGPIPLKDGEKEQLQADFKRQYGIKRGQFRYIISPAAMDWQQMGRPTKDLMLFEEIQDDIMRICDGFGYPSPLLNSDKGPAVANTKEFKAQVYQDSIIPESLDIYEQWNSFLKLDPTKLVMVKDYDHLPILKSDAVQDGRASLYSNQSLVIQFQNNQITWNEWRVENGYDEKPGMDKYYSQLLSEGWTFGSNTPPAASQNENTDANTNEAGAGESASGAL